MHRDYDLYLQDLIDAINKIQQYTEGLSYETFKNNQLIIDATILNVITLGEIARKIPDDILLEMKEISWKALIGMRNILVHQYHRVDIGILWNLIETELEKIKVIVELLINKK